MMSYDVRFVEFSYTSDYRSQMILESFVWHIRHEDNIYSVLHWGRWQPCRYLGLNFVLTGGFSEFGEHPMDSMLFGLAKDAKLSS